MCAIKSNKWYVCMPRLFITWNCSRNDKIILLETINGKNNFAEVSKNLAKYRSENFVGLSK